MTISGVRQPSQASPDPIDAWIAAHPWGGDGSGLASSEPSREQDLAERLRPDRPGAYCVNRALFEELARIEGRGRLEPAPPPEEWTPEARRIRWRVARTFDAWRLAERAYADGLRSSPAFAILEPQPSPDRRTPSRRRLTDAQRSAQRHRYKGAAAAALEEFARTHLHRDPRAGLYRPRWIDHRPECRSGRCGGCRRIPLPPPPPWMRGRKSRRRRDWLTVPEWLLDRATASRGCQTGIGLRDAECGGIVVVPQSCHVRTCPDCEAARQTRVVAKYRAAVAALDPTRTGFLTLTVRSPEPHELERGLVKLSADLERLRRRALWKGGRCRDRRRCRMPWDPDKPGWRLPHPPVTASMTTLEHTYNTDTRRFHPHLHIILEGRIDQAELADAWEAITGDSRVVWIESVAKHAADRWAGDTEAALRELLKYAAKPSPGFLDRARPHVLAELLVALRGRHLTSTSGRLYGLGLDDADDEADLVLVWPPGEAERPYHAPRICPHHNGPGAWEVLPASIRRRDCTPAPDLSRPGRRILTWHPPPVAGDG